MVNLIIFNETPVLQALTGKILANHDHLQRNPSSSMPYAETRANPDHLRSEKACISRKSQRAIALNSLGRYLLQ
jgi:hypothetical protein